MGKLEGKVALVTGAAGGIGRASAILFAREGAKVVAMDRSDAVNETVAMIQKEGGTACARTGDVSNEADIVSLIDFTVDKYGQLDCCFANAGVSGGGVTPLLELTRKNWEDILSINLIGVFLTVQNAARVMLPRRTGAIVCTASAAGIRSGAGGAPYSASKAGVISLVQTTANMMAGSGVRINAVCPGLIETNMTRPTFEYAKARGTEGKLGQLNPLRRPGQPEEIAKAALFLVSDEGSYVNGQALAVDGGLSSSHPVTRRGF